MMPQKAKVRRPSSKFQEEMWRQRHIELAEQFDRYILEHPKLLEQMPDDVVICIQVESDEAFNEWSRRWVERVTKGKASVVYVLIKKLRQVRSRIEKLELELTGMG